MPMNAILVRVAVDQAYGQWNAPVCPDSNEFVYIPIPESGGTLFKSGLARKYTEIQPAFDTFSRKYATSLTFPSNLMNYDMHLDPDFEHLTYGDQGERRGAGIARLGKGDVLAFYAGFKPIRKCEHKLLYGLLGLFVIEEIVQADAVPESRWMENAHTRKLKRGTPDIVVRANPRSSGRFEKCIPIGEWREGAYRIRHDLIDTWGGLSVKNGFIQRSAVPPTFLDGQKFYDWFLHQNVKLHRRNN